MSPGGDSDDQVLPSMRHAGLYAQGFEGTAEVFRKVARSDLHFWKCFPCWRKAVVLRGQCGPHPLPS